MTKRLTCRAAAALGYAVIALAPVTALAQEATETSGPPPVLNPEASINGVDMVTGAFSEASPFSLSAPAAGHVGYRSSFNGSLLIPSPASRPMIHEAPAATSIKGWEWVVTVTTAAGAHVFDCEYDGTDFICSIADSNRGVSLSVSVFSYNASLNRVDPKDYVFIARDGTRYEFASAAVQLNTESTPLNGFIKFYTFPSGEKLTFSGGWTAPSVTNNLGYSANLGTPQLKKGSTVLSSLTVSKSPGSYYQETDALGRVYRSNWTTDTFCGQTGYRVTSVVSPSGLTTSLTYGATRSRYKTLPVTSLTRGGVTWTYTPNHGANTISLAWPEGGTTTVTSNMLGTAGACNETYNSSGMVLSVSDPLSRVSNYTWLTDKLVATARHPEGDGADYTYDDRGNLLTVKRRRKTGSSDVTDNVTIYEAGYSATPSGYDMVCADSDRKVCNQPLWEKDALGNQTDYTYYTVHGGKKTVTLPADANGYRLRTFYTYTAYATGDGDIYRLTRTETCGLLSGELSLTACPTTRGGVDVRHLTAVTVTSYGTATTAPNTYNTFLPYQVTTTDGGNFLSATTTYAYDAWGRVTSTDGPLSGTGDTSYVTYDAVGRKVFEIAPDPDGGGNLKRAAVKHTYNADDQEIKTETGTVTGTDGSGFVVSSFTRMTYDALGRLTKTEVVQP